MPTKRQAVPPTALRRRLRGRLLCKSRLQGISFSSRLLCSRPCDGEQRRHPGTRTSSLLRNSVFPAIAIFSAVSLPSVAQSGDPAAAVGCLHTLGSKALLNTDDIANGGAFVTAAGTISQGQTVAVRQPISGASGTTTTATLTIGGVAGTLAVTTGTATQSGILQVGADKPFQTITAAVNAAQAGDAIEIDAGIYANETITIGKDNLTLRGVGGRAHVKWGTGDYLTNTATIGNGKAIFVVGANNVTIENIEFSGAKVVDENVRVFAIKAGISQSAEVTSTTMKMASWARVAWAIRSS